MGLGKISSDEYATDTTIQYATERILLLGTENITDIGNHILTSFFSEYTETYSEILVLLGKKKVISPKLTKELEGMTGFRNILAHDYLDIDPNKVFVNFKKAPKLFK